MSLLDNEREQCQMCNEWCSAFSEYQDDTGVYCSLDCWNEADDPEPEGDFSGASEDEKWGGR